MGPHASPNSGLRGRRHVLLLPEHPLQGLGVLASASTSISIATSAPGAGGTPSSERLSRVIPNSARFDEAVP
jgi:hypothetical protein